MRLGVMGPFSQKHDVGPDFICSFWRLSTVIFYDLVDYEFASFFVLIQEFGIRSPLCLALHVVLVDFGVNGFVLFRVYK